MCSTLKLKLYKCIKFLICGALICSMVSPSYASMTYADGSAFITKEEFDKTVANFNRRLSEFEAGVNSKIDVQVSSYLDRNGIWSKKAQKIDGTGIYQGEFLNIINCTRGNATSYTHNNSQTIWINYKNASYTDVVVPAGGYTNHEEKLGDIVLDVDKYGLMNVIGHYGDDSAKFMGLIRTDSNYGNDACIVLRLVYKIRRISGTKDTEEWSASWQWENNSNEGFYSNYNQVNAVFPKYTICAYFFVQKHDKIYCSVEGQTLCKGSGVRMNANNVIEIGVDEANVY